MLNNDIPTWWQWNARLIGPHSHRILPAVRLSTTHITLCHMTPYMYCDWATRKFGLQYNDISIFSGDCSQNTHTIPTPWWRNNIWVFSPLLALCARDLPMDFPTKGLGYDSQKAGEQTAELSVIWDVLTLTWRYGYRLITLVLSWKKMFLYLIIFFWGKNNFCISSMCLWDISILPIHTCYFRNVSTFHAVD